MNIQNPSIGLPAAPRAGMPVAGSKANTSGLPGAQKVHTAGAEDSRRPVRLNRAPEEAALFAYNRQAQTSAPQAPSQVDEYV